jgi:hypothetical protein
MLYRGDLLYGISVLAGYLREEIERNEITITTCKADGSPDRSAYDHRLCKELVKADRSYGDALVL